MSARWMRMTAVLAVVGGALAGCSGTPGAAAVVNGDVISEATLAQTVRDLGPLSDQAVEPANTLQAMIVSRFWLVAAQEAGFGASEDDARAYLDQIAADSQLDPIGASAGAGLVEIAQAGVAQNTANAAGAQGALTDAVTELIAAADIEVNPRYGEWSATSGLTPVTQPWIVPTTPAVQ